VSANSTVNQEPRYRLAAQSYADTVWTRFRGRSTNLFRFDPSRPPSLLEQAAVVQIFATLAAHP
jgi:hypothetical protein